MRQKYSTRSLRVRTGDRVKIMRGQFKKTEGKVEEVDTKNSKIYIAKIEHTKRDGTKARYPIDPSNLLIVEVNTDDKKRFDKQKKAEPKTEKVSSQNKAEPRPVSKPAQKPASPVHKSEKIAEKTVKAAATPARPKPVDKTVKHSK